MMSIWFKPYTTADIQWALKNNMAETLGIEIIELTQGSLIGRMPVDHRTMQTRNILHGGASAALAETLGSIASNLVVDINKYTCVGLNINANHLRPVSSGFVFGEAKPKHIGKKTHIWDIEIKNEQDKLVCVSRLTMAVLLLEK
jgi:1,4-dihydroxy-2-naphthoyl-CoA hydrolase